MKEKIVLLFFFLILDKVAQFREPFSITEKVHRFGTPIFSFHYSQKIQGFEAQGALDGWGEEQSWKQGEYLKVFYVSFVARWWSLFLAKDWRLILWRNCTKQVRSGTWRRVATLKIGLRECQYSAHLAFSPLSPPSYKIWQLSLFLALPTPPRKMLQWNPKFTSPAHSYMTFSLLK